jgi:hypothetical protein
MNRSTREIEREVEQTRADIDQTTRELREKFTVGQLVDETSRMFGGRETSDFFSNLGRQVRDNPLPVLLVGIGLAWLMASSSRPRYRPEYELEPYDEPYTPISTRSAAARSRYGEIPTQETVRLIASDKGTRVYNLEGERLGHVRNFMIDKYSGEVAYAVMSFGGFLGMGERSHPLPWRALDYDREMEGFVVDLDRSTLERGPSYEVDDDPWSRDPSYGRTVCSYYGYEAA